MSKKIAMVIASKDFKDEEHYDNIITANGPSAAEEFGRKIIEVLSK